MNVFFAKSRALIVTMLAILSGVPLAFSAQIALPTQSTNSGATIIGDVAFASQGVSLSGVQFDVIYDNSALSLSATLGTAAKTAGKTLYAVDVAPNKKRFLIIGLNQTSITDGTLLSLSVNVNSSAASGVYALEVLNVCGTDRSGDPESVSGSDGTVTVNGTTSARLQSSGVLNAGSFLSGPVAPGEIVTLTGSGIGPSSAQYPTGAATSTVLGGMSVSFDGTPAPLLYAAPDQINAVVPYAVSGKTVTQLTVIAQGQTIAAVAQPVVPAAPAIFTINSSGTGAGAILNQDLSVNSPSNPVAKGSAISIYATGAGQTNPPGVDGQLTGTVLPAPLLPVTVQIGGIEAQVLYAGAAPGLISGALQVNALIPSQAVSGPAVPVVLAVGQASSQPSVTVSIK